MDCFEIHYSRKQFYKMLDFLNFDKEFTDPITSLTGVKYGKQT